MADDELRSMERKWRKAGSVEDEEAFETQATGQVERDREPTPEVRCQAKTEGGRCTPGRPRSC